MSLFHYRLHVKIVALYSLCIRVTIFLLNTILLLMSKFLYTIVYYLFVLASIARYFEAPWSILKHQDLDKLSSMCFSCIRFGRMFFRSVDINITMSYNVLRSLTLWSSTLESCVWDGFIKLINFGLILSRKIKLIYPSYILIPNALSRGISNISVLVLFLSNGITVKFKLYFRYHIVLSDSRC